MASIGQMKAAVTFFAVVALFLAAFDCARPAAAAHIHIVSSSVISSASIRQPLVALTFDDGPSSYTPQILQILRAYHAHATFFVVGKEVPGNATTLRQELKDGNEIGNHTYTHADLEYLPNEPVQVELQATQEAVKSATGYTPGIFRPPYGAIDARVAGLAAAEGLRSITWDVDPRDWSMPGVGWIVSNVLANVHPGAIVIMHDGGGNRAETVAALPAILQALHSRGLRTATVSQLLGLPDARLCDTNKALSIFNRDGAHAHPTHAIFNAWSDELCRGVDLGPATTGERVTRRNVISQDFAKTGHRISWHDKTGVVQIHVVWIDAYHAFSAHGIRPRWGSTITTEWFRDFFGGHSWGAALKPMFLRGAFSSQAFTGGTALSWGSKIEFRPAHSRT